MSRVTGAVLVVVALLAPGLAIASPASAAVVYSESFEQGWGGWEPAADERIRDWEVTRDACDDPLDGAFCLHYHLDGTWDDGTVWVERQFEVPSGVTVIDVSFWLWSANEACCGGWQVVAYIGADQPEQETDFTIVGGTNEAEGWKQYKHSAPVEPFTSSSRVWVAFGLSVVWETVRIDPFDLVTVEMG